MSNFLSISDHGTLGTPENGTLSLDIHEITEHFHNKERWVGSACVTASLIPYTLTTGSNAFGTGILIMNSGQTPLIAGTKTFDFHRVMVSNNSITTPYVLRFIYSNIDNQATAENAGSFTNIMFQNDITKTNVAGGGPVDIMMPRLTTGVYNVWAKGKSQDATATMGFFVGLHEYDK